MKSVNRLKQYRYFLGLYFPYLTLWSWTKIPLLFLKRDVTVQFTSPSASESADGRIIQETGAVLTSVSDLFFVCNKLVLGNKLNYVEEFERVSFEFNGRVVVLPKSPDDGRAYWFIRNNVFNTFVKEEYLRLHVEGKHVLDIGTCVGDSTIYFMLKGAASVVTMEPVKYFADLAEAAFQANGMSGQVTLIRAGIPIVSMSYHGKFLSASSTDKQMGALPLDNSTMTMADSDTVFGSMPVGSCLKMDAELAELALLRTDITLLQRFDQIILEYHSREYVMIADRLKVAGFNVDLSDGPYPDERFECTGIIYASKIRALPAP
jgi:FkbM family methyltransferase